MSQELKGFTPGPWFVSPNSNYVRAKGVHGWNIATIEVQHPYKEANALLISKAPELMEENTKLKAQVATLREAANDAVATLHRWCDHDNQAWDERDDLTMNKLTEALNNTKA